MKIDILFIVLFAVLYSLNLSAQNHSNASELSTVEVSASQEASPATYFPQIPLESLPLSSQVLSESEKDSAQILRLSDITRVDASASDSYNASGYWDFLTVRGYTLDNRFSYLREGLPINAETSIPLDNKKSIEILNGLSGMQIGASSPGGMVNLNVLRPPALGTAKKIFTSVNDEGGYLFGADVGGRLEKNAYRAVVAYEELKPPIDHNQGHRYLVSYAHDFIFSDTTLLQFEIENSKRSQPSQASLSLLGNRIPDPAPRVNLNNQPWTTPVVFGATTSTLAFHHRFSAYLQGSVIFGIQDLKTDDRLAYPYGCSAENNFDRYCSDGSFDVYDFRSDNEHRRSESAKVVLSWTDSSGALSHALQVGALAYQNRDRFNKQAYNYVGIGNTNTSPVLPEDGSLNDENTNRDSDVLDLFAYDSVKYYSWGLWAGARSSHIKRSSVRTNGSRPTSYDESYLLPWAAVSYDFENAFAYLSYGTGVETFVTPNRPTYTNPGQFVDDVRSQQFELGLRDPKGAAWKIAVFEIHRPVVADAAPEYKVDGKAAHRGIEAEVKTDVSAWTLGASTMLLEAKRVESTLQPDLNDKRPVNVPKSIWRAFTNYNVNANLKLSGLFSYEGDRAITGDNSLLLKSWSRWDLGGIYTWRRSPNTFNAQLFIENVLDSKFWKESPTQYGHIYLYAAKERTLTLSLNTTF
ncbi:hypothetical protein AZI86_16420 [Bdellovibrio bacteriovorus]|uniref:TonB-dependent receptor plug domain-containing protein n=1 Tax=Bdellovibrio bacteriovorus TaxID=959 RepID=A0A150WHM2_BDEBC|nr:TonB-dependent receptor plug domain-containing protein [Bdellovibrio bacteriovorus]KYG62416.1 hypothetical protein AZI86_16420 [Bdellovibrio bacteriovorus]